MNRFRKLFVWVAALAIPALTGCAAEHHTVARQNMAQAQTSVDMARQAGAQTDAPVEFRQAQDKLAAAQAAAKDEKFDKAKRLAQEASVDADLAQQKAQSARAQRSVAELRQDINLLRQEMGLPPES
jgi:hypothetical protein